MSPVKHRRHSIFSQKPWNHCARGAPAKTRYSGHQNSRLMRARSKHKQTKGFSYHMRENWKQCGDTAGSVHENKHSCAFTACCWVLLSVRRVPLANRLACLVHWHSIAGRKACHLVAIGLSIKSGTSTIRWLSTDSIGRLVSCGPKHRWTCLSGCTVVGSLALYGKHLGVMLEYNYQTMSLCDFCL